MDKLDFLKTVTPFNLLPAELLPGISENLEEIKFNKDIQVYQQEVSKMKGIDIIAEGEYEAFFYDSDQNKRVVEFHQPGFCYGGISILLNQRKSLQTIVAKKGTVVYFLSRHIFKELCNAYEDFYQYFTAEFGKRMRNEEFAHFFKRPTSFEESYVASEQLYSRKIESVEYREVFTCPANAPVYEAAAMMATYKTSCIFIKGREGKIVGYVTDITLRDNVIAKQEPTDIPVYEIMDNPIVSIAADAYIYDALLMMFQTKTRYLLVEKDGQYIGFLSRNKLLSEQAESPLNFIQSVKLSVSVDELKRKWEQVPQIVTQLLSRGIFAGIVNQVITTVSDTIAQKVIASVIEEMGAPPAKFVFMVLGSEGRKEQTLNTDQDNAIIYEDKANEHREEVREYFLKFADIVSAKLDFIGFSFCTGGFMAKNSKWTHSLSHWKKNYEKWMEDALPETVIHFSTFFDCRLIYGDENIMKELTVFLDKQLQKPMEKLFFFMAKNALQYEPPLTGFFKNIRTFTLGNQEVFDIKKSMTPIVDLVRLYSLKNRIFEVNTGDRMKALKAAGIFSEIEFEELNQSYYYLMSLRLRKQAMQILHDKTHADNNIPLSRLSKIEMVTLKEIFKTIESFQTGVKLKFTNTIF